MFKVGCDCELIGMFLTSDKTYSCLAVDSYHLGCVMAVGQLMESTKHQNNISKSVFCLRVVYQVLCGARTTQNYTRTGQHACLQWDSAYIDMPNVE